MSDNPADRSQDARAYHAMLPAYVLEQLTQEERYTVEAIARIELNLLDQTRQQHSHSQRISKLEDAVNGLQAVISDLKPRQEQAVVAVNNLVATVSQLENWRALLMGKVGIIVWLITIALPTILQFLISLLKHNSNAGL